MPNYDKWTVHLTDDGTLDTVVDIHDENGSIVDTARWDHETAADWRDEAGDFTEDGWEELVCLTMIFTIESHALEDK